MMQTPTGMGGMMVVLLLSIASVSAQSPRESLLPFELKPHADSVSRRFAVYGDDMSDCVGWANWMEDTANRLERLLKREPAFGRADRVTLWLNEPDVPEGQIVTDDRLVYRSYQQRMRVGDMDRIPERTVRHAFCRLLFDRWIRARAKAGGRDVARIRSAPDWLIGGAAAVLYSDERMPVYRTAIASLKEGSLSAVRQILLMETAVSATETDRHIQGVFVDWLMSWEPEGTWLDTLIDRRAAGALFTPGDLLDVRGEGMTTDRLEREWWLWVAQLRQRRSLYEPITREVLREVPSALIFRREYADEPPTYVPNRLRPVDLIAYRGAPWLKELVAPNLAQLYEIRLGRPPSLNRVVEQYIHFLLEVSRPESTAGEAELYDKLQEADRALSALAAWVETRK